MTAPLTGVRCEVVEVFGVTTQVEEEERRGQWMYHSSALWAQAVSVSVSVLCTINGVMFGQGKSGNLFCGGHHQGELDAQLESDSERDNITHCTPLYCTVLHKLQCTIDTLQLIYVGFVIPLQLTRCRLSVTACSCQRKESHQSGDFHWYPDPQIFQQVSFISRY